MKMRKYVKRIVTVVSMLSLAMGLMFNNSSLDTTKNSSEDYQVENNGDSYIKALIEKAELTNFNETTELEKYVTINKQEMDDVVHYSMKYKQPSEKFVDEYGIEHSIYTVCSSVLSKKDDEKSSVGAVDVKNYYSGNVLIARHWVKFDEISTKDGNFHRLYRFEAEPVQNNYGIRTVKFQLADGEIASTIRYNLSKKKVEKKILGYYSEKFSTTVNLGAYGKVCSKQIAVNSNYYYPNISNPIASMGTIMKAEIKATCISNRGVTSTYSLGSYDLQFYY